MSSLIQLKDINKYYGEGKGKASCIKVIKYGNWNKGEFLMIMGKSGSGKTTPYEFFFRIFR